MTATLTLDEAGRLLLPEAALQTLGVKPGAELQVEVTRRGIELLGDDSDDAPLMTALSPDGLPMLPPGVPKRGGMSVVEAIKADREERMRKIAGR